MEHRGGVERLDIWQGISLLSRAIETKHIPLQPFSSFLRRANADMRGLSCKLFPFFPRSPHRLGTASSCCPVPPTMPCPARSLFWIAGVLFEEPPRMAATDEWAHRACLRMADVTVMHSVTTSATGLTATGMRRGSARVIASWIDSDSELSDPSLDMLKGGFEKGGRCADGIASALGEVWRGRRSRLCGLVSKLEK